MNMKARSFLALVGAATLLVVACGDDDAATTTATQPASDAPATTAPAPSMLAGTEWIVDRLTLSGADYPLVIGSSPTIAFPADRQEITGSTGCNSYFGAVSFTPGQGISIDQLGMTEMACVDPAELMEQEATFAAALPTIAFYTVMDDGLTMVSGDGSVTISAISREAAVPDVDLDGAEWFADTRMEGGGASTMIQGTEVTLLFPKFGDTVRGTTGCNSFEATMGGDDGAIELSDFQVTERGCEPNVMEQEEFVLRILNAAVAYDIRGDRLTIVTPDGDGLSFVARQ
jgi:heat shock protein HslJ